MYLAFDTETTDLPRAHLELAHPFQPHLIQFGAIVFDDLGYETDRLFTLVKPGPTALLSTTAHNAHGISLERANREGMDPFDVFLWFMTAANNASRIIGHNVQFDIHIMRILGARLTGQVWAPPCPLFCTMANAAPIVNLPPTARMLASGRNYPKPPTLSECVGHFFGEELPEAHDAGADVVACIRVFHRLALA
jgi:DNA polymerase-3 subunit epsilon